MILSDEEYLEFIKKGQKFALEKLVDELQERVSEWHPLFLAYYHFEIIGNIYENTRLLEVEG